MAQSNLLVLTSYWPTASNPITGIFVVQQLAALCRAQCQITVLVTAEIGKSVRHLAPDEFALPADQVTFATLPVFRAPETLSSNSIAFWSNIRSIGLSTRRAVVRFTRATDKLDGCIIHGLRYLTLSADHWADDIATRKISFIHGVDPFLQRPSIAGLVPAYIRRLEPTIDKFAIVGSPLQDYTSSLGIDPAKLIVIPNGTDIPPLPASRSLAGADGLRIVSVSNLVALKGIDDNLRALHLLQDRFGIRSWEYVIVGDGPERARLEALAATLGLGDKVKFLGRLPYADTMQEISNADIFSLPSWGEAFGIVYLEAMARMKPTIGCFDNGAADIITDGQDGILVPPKDPSSLALAFKRLFDDPGFRDILGQRGRSTAENFSWDENAKRVMEVLRS